jgi:hypothetical protein
MSIEQALDVWFTEQQPSVGAVTTVLAAMFERDAARELGLVELYDEIVIESERYDGDPPPLARSRVQACTPLIATISKSLCRR